MKALLLTVAIAQLQPLNQYDCDEFVLPLPKLDMRTNSVFSEPSAAEYLSRGNLAWSNSMNCVSCHTTGSYMFVHCRLAGQLGTKPQQHLRDFFVRELGYVEGREGRNHIRTASGPARMSHLAVGLATWDKYVERRSDTSWATDLSLRLALSAKSVKPDGVESYAGAKCCPPFQADSFSVALWIGMAASTAPGWLQEAKKDARATYTSKKNDVRAKKSDATPLKMRVDSLEQQLRSEEPPHDHARVQLLLAAKEWDGLLSPDRIRRILRLIIDKQNEDGGWSTYDFSAPDAWTDQAGVVNLAGPDVSDGYMTGLATTALLLHDSGLDEELDRSVDRGLGWLEINQRQGGWWWTPPLTQDAHRFIVYTGSCYSYLALGLGNRLKTKRK